MNHGDTTGELCERDHYCPACTDGGCLLGTTCVDLHAGACCGSLVACDCETCG